MKALISKSPHIENILEGKKTWDIRGSKTNIRSKIALIKSGSGQIVGKCKIVECIGPLSIDDLKNNTDKHCLAEDQITRVFGKYKTLYSWVLSDVVAITKPISYDHQKGAIIWVNLNENNCNLLINNTKD
jgi:hypothetical protein